MSRGRRQPAIYVTALGVLLLAGLVAVSSAYGATLDNVSPSSPAPLVDRLNHVTLSLRATADPGQTIAGVATLVIDGGAPINVGAAYRIDHWEPYYDGEYGEWYDIPVYDYTQATFQYTMSVPVGGHTAVLTVREQPSNAALTGLRSLAHTPTTTSTATPTTGTQEPARSAIARRTRRFLRSARLTVIRRRLT